MKKVDDKRVEIEEIWAYRVELRLYLSAFDIPPHQVEDVVQETLIAAWRGASGLKDREKLKAWIFTIARNEGKKCAKEARLYLEHNISLEEKIEKNDELELCYRQDCNLCAYANVFKDDDLAEAMGKLSGKERKILMMYYCYGHSHREISQMLGENYSSTRSAAARARKKLKEQLTEYEGNEF